MMSSNTTNAEKQLRLNRIIDQSKLFAKYQKDVLIDLITEAKKATVSPYKGEPVVKKFILSFNHGVPSESQTRNFIEMYRAFSNTEVKLEIIVEPKKEVTKFFLYRAK